MGLISVALDGSLENTGLKEKYMPMIKILADSLYRCYAYDFPTTITSEIADFQSKECKVPFPMWYARFFVNPIRKFFRLPDYYVYFYRHHMTDYLYSKKIKDDKSSIIFCSVLNQKMILNAKSAGKIVVVEAGNSEPEREYQKIIREYDKFKIKRRYIYGDSRYKNICKTGLENADWIITISEVSKKTYIDAGYDMNKFKTIYLTGTDFPIRTIPNRGGRKAFISTAFHSFIKGTHRLLLAWRKANINNIPLIIVGRLCDDMKEFIKTYGPFQNVRYVGFQGDLRSWYQDYDAVGVLMSLSEGAVRTTPEMMSFGFPMITSPDATCDIVKDGENGYIIESDNENGLAERLRWFAEDWDRVHAMRANVLMSVSRRTVSDYSCELAQFMLSICN